MKKELNIIEERVCKGMATNGLMQFGRKAPTASELRAQWREQQKQMEDVREKFTTAVLV